MKRRTILITLGFTSGLIATAIAIFLLAEPGTPVQAAHCTTLGSDCGEASFYNLSPSVCNNVGTMDTQFLEAGGFEGNPEIVFAHWSAGDAGAFQRTGYMQYEGAFSMRLHASLGNYPQCAALNPWLYQTVRIPDGVLTATHLAVGGYYAVGGSLAECSIVNSTDVDDELYVQLLDGEGTPVSDAILLTHGGIVTETWFYFIADFTDSVDLESLAGQDVRVFFYAVHDVDPNGTWFYLDDLTFDVCPYQATPGLDISKTGPAKATPGEPITFTLTITNYGPITATNVLITDAIPSGANVVEPVPGGSVDLPVVAWTVDELGPNDAAISVQFVVTATQTITNSDYGVSCAEGVSVTGSEVIITKVGWHRIYLPVTLR